MLQIASQIQLTLEFLSAGSETNQRRFYEKALEPMETAS